VAGCDSLSTPSSKALLESAHFGRLHAPPEGGHALRSSLLELEKAGQRRRTGVPHVLLN
jgi:hypothetical protein